jgi:hypothetical protein
MEGGKSIEVNMHKRLKKMQSATKTIRNFIARGKKSTACPDSDGKHIFGTIKRK